MIQLRKPEKTFSQLQAIAASGSSGLSRKAQDELIKRTCEALRRGLGR